MVWVLVLHSGSADSIPTAGTATDLFLSFPLYFFPYARLSSYLLHLSVGLILFLLFPCASVWVPSCLSSPFPMAMLNATSFFLSLVQEKLNMPCGRYNRYCSCSGHLNYLIQNYILGWCSHLTFIFIREVGGANPTFRLLLYFNPDDNVPMKHGDSV